MSLLIPKKKVEQKNNCCKDNKNINTPIKKNIIIKKKRYEIIDGGIF